jgi:hypothetical protein
MLAFGLGLAAFGVGNAAADPRTWRTEWPRTDFSRHAVDFAEIRSGGPPKDGIPAIDHPRLVDVDDVKDLADNEPVVGLMVGDEARAYPARILIWHEIVNDTVGGVPVAVTFCPLCNSAAVFDRRVDGRVLDFGTTGKLRHSDLVMYDRQTESWWQQFTGAAIVGAMTGARLAALPARFESFANFRARAPRGKVLAPSDARARRYGINPYVGYDSAARPFLYTGGLPSGIAPMARVVAVGNEAWSLDLLRSRGRIERDGLVLTWAPGQASALDTARIADGRDVGNVIVQRRTPEGMTDAVHDVVFAFVFHAFHPDGRLHLSLPH